MSNGPITFCSFPHDDVMSATASFRRCNRSLKTPVIIPNGISRTRTSAPTPNSLMIVLKRRVNGGCDFGNGGRGVCVSVIGQNHDPLHYIRDTVPKSFTFLDEIDLNL